MARKRRLYGAPPRLATTPLFVRHPDVHYVYLLQSRRDRGLYTAYTQDPCRRFGEHNCGKIASTRKRRPLRLLSYEAYLLEADAKARERFLKSGAGRRHLAKLPYETSQVESWIRLETAKKQEKNDAPRGLLRIDMPLPGRSERDAR